MKERMTQIRAHSAVSDTRGKKVYARYRVKTNLFLMSLDSGVSVHEANIQAGGNPQISEKISLQMLPLQQPLDFFLFFHLDFPTSNNSGVQKIHHFVLKDNHPAEVEKEGMSRPSLPLFGTAIASRAGR